MPICSVVQKIVLLGVVVFVASCGTIRPEAPKKKTSEVIPEYNQPVSVINIPITIDLKPYFDETEKAVPKSFSGNEAKCEGVSVAYFFRRGTIKFKGKGSDIYFDVDGEYSMKMNYCPQCTELFNDAGNCIVPRIYASCGVNEAMPKLHISFKSSIGIDQNYRLTSTTKLQSVKAITPCRVTMFNYNATGHVEDEVSKALRSAQKDIDKEIKSINLKSDMQEVWNLLREPVDLEGYGYFYINPQSIGIDELKYQNSTATFNASLSTKPYLNLEKEIIAPASIPQLQKITKSDGFSINMDIKAGYDSLARITNKEIGGSKFEVKGKEVIIDSIGYFPYGDQLGVKVNFSGKKKGIVYLVGTPELDTLNQVLSLPDLEFDVKTKSLLLKSAKWLFDAKITEMIRKYAIIDLKPYLADLKEGINTSLNGELSEGIRMSGAIKEAKVLAIHPLESHLFIQSFGSGWLEIKM